MAKKLGTTAAALELWCGGEEVAAGATARDFQERSLEARRV